MVIPIWPLLQGFPEQQRICPTREKWSGEGLLLSPFFTTSFFVVLILLRLLQVVLVRSVFEENGKVKEREREKEMSRDMCLS